MPIVIDQVEHATPGSSCFLGSVSADGRAAVVFEDDGDTGYFYACGSAQGPIFDSLHIYNVKAVTDRSRPSEFKIGWSPSGRQAALLVNDTAHAVFDFDRQKGWCRTGLPLCNKKWSLDGHTWDESCLAYFL